MVVDGGKGRDETEGTEDLLVYCTGEWHRTRCIGFKHGLVYIFTRAHSNFQMGTFRLLIIIILVIFISNLIILVFYFLEFPMPNSDSCNAFVPPAAFPLCVALRCPRVPVKAARLQIHFSFLLLHTVS
jgi:hypothetical protein